MENPNRFITTIKKGKFQKIFETENIGNKEFIRLVLTYNNLKKHPNKPQAHYLNQNKIEYGLSEAASRGRPNSSGH